MTFGLCKYKDSLGIPKQGIHQYRFLQMALMDIIFTIIGAAIISYFAEVKMIYTLPSLFLLGIFLHRLFCVRTRIDVLLFG